MAFSRIRYIPCLRYSKVNTSTGAAERETVFRNVYSGNAVTIPVALHSLLWALQGIHCRKNSNVDLERLYKFNGFEYEAYVHTHDSDKDP